jgi:competence protein ComEC
MNLKALLSAALISVGLLVSSAATNIYASPSLDSLTVSAASLELPAVPEAGAPAALRPPLKAVPALNAYFISVGQGDAEYIELPNGKNVLIDGGPNPNAPLAAFLTQHNVTKLDYVVLTHPHLDHYAGLDYVFSHVKVENFYDTREDNTGAAGAKAIRNKIAALGVNVIYPAAGDNLDWDPAEVQVKVLNTCSNAGGSNSGPVLNNCSIVLKVTYQNTSILYTGDMQFDTEAALISAYGSQLQSDVLKVGHHGSNTATSPAFLNMVKPKYAYIEVGANNTFAFPAASTLANLQAAGAAIYRTDMGGTQEFRIGGN